MSETNLRGNTDAQEYGGTEMNPNDMPGYLGLPSAAYQDTSGDKDSKVSRVDAWEVLMEIIISTNVNKGFLYLGWVLQVSGNAVGYQVLLFTVFSLGLGFLFWAIYRYFHKGNKPKVTWKLFNWGLGSLLALLLHYVF